MSWSVCAGCEDRLGTARQVLTAIRPYVDSGEVPGAVVGVWRDGEVPLDAAAVVALDGGAPRNIVEELPRCQRVAAGCPDAVAWCWAKGGDWRRIEPVVTDVREA